MTTRKKCVIKSTKHKRKEKRDDHEEEKAEIVNCEEKEREISEPLILTT